MLTVFIPEITVGYFKDNDRCLERPGALVLLNAHTEEWHTFNAPRKDPLRCGWLAEVEEIPEFLIGVVRPLKPDADAHLGAEES